MQNIQDKQDDGWISHDQSEKSPVAGNIAVETESTNSGNAHFFNIAENLNWRVVKRYRIQNVQL